MSPSNEERAPVFAPAPDPIDFDPNDLVFRELELLDMESTDTEPPEVVWFAPPPPPSSPPRAIATSRPPPPDPIGDELADAWFR